MRLSIGEAADRLGVSVRTLRWYDEIGLVKPAAVGENGYRYYGREEMALLQQAVFYKELGLPLKEIKPLLQAPEDTRRRALLAHKELLKLKKQQLEGLLAVSDAVGMGCGLGQSPWAAALVKNVLEWLGGEIVSAVIDADALNLLAKLDTTDLDLSRCVLTPHPGEAARLLGCTVGEIGADAVAAALQLRQRWGAAGGVLKGAASVIATQSGMALNRIGTPALAKGGSGDVLTGVLAALLGLNARMAAAADAEDDPRRPLPLRELLQVQELLQLFLTHLLPFLRHCYR